MKQITEHRMSDVLPLLIFSIVCLALFLHFIYLFEVLQRLADAVVNSLVQADKSIIHLARN